jgi:hypothetical protein
MTRLVVRFGLAAPAALGIFWLAYRLTLASGAAFESAVVVAELAALPWAVALGIWAAWPPRREPTYYAPVSTREPTPLDPGYLFHAAPDETGWRSGDWVSLGPDDDDA